MIGGLEMDLAGLKAVKTMFWSAVVNCALAPPLILLVILLTSNREVMGADANSRSLRVLGWITIVFMTVCNSRDDHFVIDLVLKDTKNKPGLASGAASSCARALEDSRKLSD